MKGVRLTLIGPHGSRTYTFRTLARACAMADGFVYGVTGIHVTITAEMLHGIVGQAAWKIEMLR
jgi:hypothetical protein